MYDLSFQSINLISLSARDLLKFGGRGWDGMDSGDVGEVTLVFNENVVQIESDPKEGSNSAGAFEGESYLGLLCLGFIEEEETEEAINHEVLHLVVDSLHSETPGFGVIIDRIWHCYREQYDISKSIQEFLSGCAEFGLGF